jgi:Zn-dependent metalloprotease
MRSRRGMGNHPYRFSTATGLYAATIVAAFLAITVPVTVYGQATGLPASPDGPGIAPTEPNPSEAEKAAAFNTLMTVMVADLGPALGMQDPSQEWTARKISLDNAGAWHFKLDQVFQGIRVVDGHLSIAMSSTPSVTPGDSIRLDEAVKLEEGGTSTSGRTVFHGDYLSDPKVDTNPVISKGEAMRIVRQMLGDMVGHHPQGKAAKGAPQKLRVDSEEADSADLEIDPGDGPGRRRLTYHVVMSDTSTDNPVQLHVWVGAQTDVAGQILRAYNNIQTINGTGDTFYQGIASYFQIAFAPQFGLYVLNDNSLRIGAFDSYSSCSATYQGSSSTPTFGNFTLGNRNSTNADTLYATVQTMSYYYYNHARNYVDNNNGPKVYQSVDGLGALLSARNHVCSNYNNAYWDGQKINLGDGDGVNFRSFATLDIIGHEWTHGVTQFEAGLIYSGESGALNESFSDILGAMAERYWKGTRLTNVGCPAGVPDCGPTWKIGEEAYTPFTSGDALRYMYRPTLDGYSKDDYNLRICTSCSSDNGGVHGNSGIQNNAFYLLANGGCHRANGCMPCNGCFGGPAGIDAAKTIFYLALRDYLIPNDGFYWARYGTQYEAGVLHGFASSQYNATRNAWDLVKAPK